jgi:hypothetical protein
MSKTSNETQPIQLNDLDDPSRAFLRLICVSENENRFLGALAAILQSKKKNDADDETPGREWNFELSEYGFKELDEALGAFLAGEKIAIENKMAPATEFCRVVIELLCHSLDLDADVMREIEKQRPMS